MNWEFCEFGSVRMKNKFCEFAILRNSARPTGRGLYSLAAANGEVAEALALG
jgi:hypothetical protein